MSVFVNDLSLCGQYQTVSEFLDDLKKLMWQRQQEPNFAGNLLCSRILHDRPVTSRDSFRQAVQSERSLIKPVLSWLTKNGPFWDDDRQQNADDYFECAGSDVTDQGLGEASRHRVIGKNAVSLSFPLGGFDYSPVHVTHGLPEAPIACLPIENWWDFSKLKQLARSLTQPPVNWMQMLTVAQSQFEKLEFVPGCVESLEMHPFSGYVVERVFELLGVLNELMCSLNQDGTYSARNHELIEQHFSGEKTWFSDESISNKRKFEKEMSFPDPEDLGRTVFCTWHGKIKSPQYRIHFEWPAKLKKLRIFYIGPKITKD